MKRHIKLKKLFFALALLPNAIRADMLITLMDYQGPVGQMLLGAADTMTTTAVGAAAVAGIYKYGKRSGYKQIMQELEVVKGQNELTHEKIQKIIRELNDHNIKLGDIKNKQADHSYDLNQIRRAIERVDGRVDTANIKLDQVHDKTTAIDNRTVRIENRTAAIEHKTIAIEDKSGQIDANVSITNTKLDKLQNSVNIHRAGQIRQTQETHGMLRGIAQILGIMHEESRSESRQILTALGQTMAKSKFLRLIFRP